MTSEPSKPIEGPGLFTLYECTFPKKWTLRQEVTSNANNSLSIKSMDELDVVTVHGINRNPEGTWMQTKWLTESLPLCFPNARVLTFGYESGLVEGGGILEAMILRQTAIDFLKKLIENRNRCNRKKTPLVFMGHDLGAVIIKEMLCIANGTLERHAKIAECTQVVICFGAPIGGNIEEWSEMLFKIVLASTTKEPFESQRRKIVGNAIQKGPTALIATTNRFKPLLKQYRVINVFAKRKTPFVGMVIPEDQEKTRDNCLEHDSDHLGLCAVNDDLRDTIFEAMSKEFQLPPLLKLLYFTICNIS